MSHTHVGVRSRFLLIAVFACLTFAAGAVVRKTMELADTDLYVRLTAGSSVIVTDCQNTNISVVVSRTEKHLGVVVLKGSQPAVGVTLREGDRLDVDYRKYSKDGDTLLVDRAADGVIDEKILLNSDGSIRTGSVNNTIDGAAPASAP